MLVRPRRVRFVHSSAAPLAAYVGARESTRAASYGTYDQSGSNMQLDPRGVDYGLFEPPSDEYVATRANALRVDTTLSPQIALLQRLLREKEWEDARRSLEQLQTLHTPLDVPLVEYLHAAQYFAATREPEAALQWLMLAPHASKLEANARKGRWAYDQAVHWLCESDASHLRQACILAAAGGYRSALTTGMTHLYRTGQCGDAAEFWERVAASYVPVTPAQKEAHLARLYNRVVRAMARGGSIDAAREWAASSAYTLDAASHALLEPAPAAPKGRSTEQAALDVRLKDAVAAEDLAHARHLLLRAQTAPGVEALAIFLAAAGRHTAIDVPRDAKQRGTLSTGQFLRPVRRAIQARERALWDTALLRARAREHDWHGALRVFQRRFQPVSGLDAALLQAAERIPHTPQNGSHAASSLANSDGRRAEHRSIKLRHLATPYTIALVLRALVACCEKDTALVQRLYTHCVRHLAPQHLSARVFEALIPALSAADPAAFVAPSGGFWTVLRDMRAAHVTPRATTWTLLLQALARDGSHSSWQLLVSLLQRMGGEASELPAHLDLPRSTPGVYAGVLHVLPRDATGTARARQLRNLVRAAADKGLETDYGPLQEQLKQLEK